MLLKKVCFVLVSTATDAFFIGAAWNYGVSGIFPVGKLDWAGAIALAVLLFVVTKRPLFKLTIIQRNGPPAEKIDIKKELAEMKEKVEKPNHDEPPSTF